MAIKNNQAVIGIDIGRTGGICVLSKRGVHLLLPFEAEKPKGDTKIEKENNIIISNLSIIETALNTANSLSANTRILIEHIYAIPKSGAASMLTFGRHSGSMFGYLYAKGYKPQVVRAVDWKRDMGLINKEKGASVKLAKELYPGEDLRRTYRCTKESDGLAEALLIAHYGLYGKKNRKSDSKKK